MTGSDVPCQELVIYLKRNFWYKDQLTFEPLHIF